MPHHLWYKNEQDSEASQHEGLMHVLIKMMRYEGALG